MIEWEPPRHIRGMTSSKLLFPRRFALAAFALTALTLPAVACTEAGEEEEGVDDVGDDDGDDDEGEMELWESVHSELDYDDQPDADEVERLDLAMDQLALGLDLYHYMGEGAFEGQNVVNSPVSIQTAFGMLYGATEGVTKTQMESTLHFTLGEERQHVAMNWQHLQLASREMPKLESEFANEDPVILGTANRAWINEARSEELIPDFLDLLAVHYDTGVYLADFNSNADGERIAINGWVADRTHGLVQDLIPVIPDGSSMVLVNTLYLKAPWATPFEEFATQTASFTLLDGSTRDVQMMQQYAMNGYYGEGEGYAAVGVPLRGNSLELALVLPEDLASFEAGLDAETLGGILEGMDYATIDTSMPRFELRAKASLKQALTDLGMPAAFDNGEDFTGVLTNGMGPIFDVIHEAVILTDEGGIEAAAATAIVQDEGGGGELEPEYTFVADKPFVVVVYDRPSRTPLFVGRVVDPGAGD
ncbi:serine protease inhibitor family protein [Plesiocystis pacifica SIR-1]|uniref:Serine protease inhibitor family protein n=2 Tax=Plesiocystis pacifica TaxID=191768 RepID=A6GDF3_9BACT|nr:serine protease inhibitor family protein [Plesiocystis pacifica SIR-1]